MNTDEIFRSLWCAVFVCAMSNRLSSWNTFHNLCMELIYCCVSACGPSGRTLLWRTFHRHNIHSLLHLCEQMHVFLGLLWFWNSFHSRTESLFPQSGRFYGSSGGWNPKSLFHNRCSRSSFLLCESAGEFLDQIWRWNVFHIDRSQIPSCLHGGLGGSWASFDSWNFSDKLCNRRTHRGNSSCGFCRNQDWTLTFSHNRRSWKPFRNPAALCAFSKFFSSWNCSYRRRMPSFPSLELIFQLVTWRRRGWWLSQFSLKGNKDENRFEVRVIKLKPKTVNEKWKCQVFGLSVNKSAFTGKILTNYHQSYYR